MTKRFKIGLSLLLAFTIFNWNIYAQQEENVTEDKYLASSIFAQLDDDEKILPLPDGGYLYGQATISDSEDTTIVLEEYDSETDTSSITVKEAKEDFLNSSDNNIQTRAATVPTTNWVLANGAAYQSGKFSGSGWRFGGYRFYPADGTGYYLLWTAYGDDGRVGNTWEATQTLNGTISGTEIYNQSPKYVNKGTLGQIFYTYNPVQNSYYVVANY